MRVGLIDIDNTSFPTLTLMKLSAWHKAQGDEVELITPEDVLKGNLFGGWDKVYASCIFDWNKPTAEMLADAGVEVGGSGWDMAKQLPDEIVVYRANGVAVTPRYNADGSFRVKRSK